MKLLFSVLSLAFLTPANGALGDGYSGRSLRTAITNKGIQHGLKNTLARWRAVLEEVDTTSHRLLQEVQANSEHTTAESLLAHMHWKTKTGMETMVDILAQASEIDLSQSDGDEPNQKFLDLLHEAKKGLETYQVAMVHNLAKMGELECDSFDKGKIAKLEKDAGTVFSDLLEQLVEVKEAELVVNAGQDDMEILLKLQGSLDATYLHILQVLDDLAPTVGAQRLLQFGNIYTGALITGGVYGMSCTTNHDCHDYGIKECYDVSVGPQVCYCDKNTCSQDMSQGFTTNVDLCFSSESTVQVLDKGTVAMKNLGVGDKVLTRGATYEPVYAFGHLEVTQKALFFQIYTKESEKKKNPLEATSDHHIFVQTPQGKKEPAPAGTLRVGDILYGLDGTQQAITKIKMVTRDGVYAPLTPSGTIIVDGIEASTYVRVHTVEGVGTIKTLYVSGDHMTHIYLAPFRMLCLGVSPIFGKFFHTEEGLIWFVAFGMKGFTAFYNTGGAFAAILLFGLACVSWFPLYAVELVFGAALGPLVILAGILLAVSAKKSGYCFVAGAAKKVKEV